MKKLLVILMLFLFTGFVYADDKKEEKFEVTINIVYNAVSSEEANRLSKLAHEKFKDTCKHEVKIKKIDQSIVSSFYYSNGSNNLILTAPSIK